MRASRARSILSALPITACERPGLAAIRTSTEYCAGRTSTGAERADEVLEDRDLQPAQEIADAVIELGEIHNRRCGAAAAAWARPRGPSRRLSAGAKPSRFASSPQPVPCGPFPYDQLPYGLLHCGLCPDNPPHGNGRARPLDQYCCQ